jgi:sporulation protein YlmC with PRC-barrel domain
MKDAINIKKEEITKLKFSKVEITDKNKRQINLNLSSTIDNLNKFQKGTIYFSTTRGLFQTTAKIMMKGDEFVVLKGDIIIPLNSIVKVGI